MNKMRISVKRWKKHKKETNLELKNKWTEKFAGRVPQQTWPNRRIKDHLKFPSQKTRKKKERRKKTEEKLKDFVEYCQRDQYTIYGSHQRRKARESGRKFIWRNSGWNFPSLGKEMDIQIKEKKKNDSNHLDSKSSKEIYTL